MLAGSLTANLVDISAEVCGVTREWFGRPTNNRLIASAKEGEAELKSQMTKRAMA